MLAKYDEAIAMVEKAMPLSPLFDEVARLRIVRVLLRDLAPALKAGNVDKARKSFRAFADRWPGVQDLIKTRSREASDAIDQNLAAAGKAFAAAKPDTDEVNGLVTKLTLQYNGVVAQITRDARASIPK